MNFLKPPPVMRTASTEEFVFQDEISGGETNPNSANPSRRGSLSGASITHDFSLPVTPSPSPTTQNKQWQYGQRSARQSIVAAITKLDARKAKYSAVGLGALCGLLSIALAVFVFLYFRGKHVHVEVCLTKECRKASLLLMGSMDDSVDPCEDFDKFACGNWMSSVASYVPLKTGSFDHLTIMRNRVIQRLRELTDNITSYDIEPLRQVKVMYDTCMDTSRIDAQGLTPLKDLLKQLLPMEYNTTFLNGTEQNGPSLAKILAKIRRATGKNYLFDAYLSSDYRDTTVNTLFIDQPDLGMDSVQYSSEVNNEAYRKLMKRAFTRLRKNAAEGTVPKIILEGNIENGSETILDLEKQMDAACSDQSTMSKAAMFNIYSLRELNRIFHSEMAKNDLNEMTNGGNRFFNPNQEKMGVALNWTEYFVEIFKDIPGGENIDENTYVIVTDLPFIKSLAGILANVNQENMQWYLNWQLIFAMGKYTEWEFQDLFNNFWETVEGYDTLPNRYTHCLNLLDDNIPFALTYRYVEKYVSLQLIDEAKEMVKNLIQAFKSMVTESVWMDKMTRDRAILKADRMRAFLGYPKWMRNESAIVYYYQGLYMNNFSFFENILTMKKWLQVKELQQIALPVDRSWSMDSPAQVNAFYDDELNAITFPAGFFQAPFFGMGLRSMDYGALGSVIGHEITHGFDKRGIYSDETGKMNTWWTMRARIDFEKKAQCFVDEYNSFSVSNPVGDERDILGAETHLNGARTLQENIADNGGVREAFRAYKLYTEDILGGKSEARLAGLEKFSPQQLFFLSFAQASCSYTTSKEILSAIETDDHSPNRFRTLGSLANFDEFSKIWKCKANSYMNPLNKCVIW